MSAVHHERGDLDGGPPGACCAARSSASTTACRRTAYRWRVAMARLLEAEGDLDGALDLLDEAERVYVGDFSPRVRPIPALKARVLHQAGTRRRRAPTGLATRACRSTDELTYLREFEHLTLARALLAEAPGRRGVGPAGPAPAGRRGGRPDRRRHRDPRACRPSPCSSAATCRRRWRRWSGRSRWPSRRATSGCSSTRARRWPTCCARLAAQGPAAAYVRRLLDRVVGDPVRVGVPRRTEASSNR